MRETLKVLANKSKSMLDLDKVIKYKRALNAYEDITRSDRLWETSGTY